MTELEKEVLELQKAELMRKMKRKQYCKEYERYVNASFDADINEELQKGAIVKHMLFAHSKILVVFEKYN